MFWMLTSVLCSVKTVTEVFICAESGVMKLLLVFVFSAISAVLINDVDASFVATNCLLLFSFLLIKAILFPPVFPADSNALLSPSFVQTACVILIGSVCV